MKKIKLYDLKSYREKGENKKNKKKKSKEEDKKDKKKKSKEGEDKKDKKKKSKEEDKKDKKKKNKKEKEYFTKETEKDLEKLIAEKGKKLVGKKSGLPSLYECAEQLKKNVDLISYNDDLYYYNGRCYDKINSNEVIKLYRNYVDKKLGCEKGLTSISQLYNFLKTDSQIIVRSYDSKRYFTVLKNGIFDIMNQELISHSSQIIAFSYVDANYDENAECKKFDKFLEQITDGDEILIKRMWMFLGYVFMQNADAKYFFVMGEAPDSGKSLVGNFIESAFPKKYVSNIALNDLNKEFSLSPLIGSCVNLSLDLPATKLNNSAISKLKMLTGGDRLIINQKYVSDASYEIRTKFIFASNHKISISGEDEAFWRRLVYLPFNKTIPKEKQDASLSLAFQKEKDAIVSKALRYAKKLIKNNFIFPSTSEIDKKILQWKDDRNLLIEKFLEECCIIDSEYRGELIDKLYRKYEKFCCKFETNPESRLVFKKVLEEQIGLKHCKMRDGGKNPQSAFRGIKLR